MEQDLKVKEEERAKPRSYLGELAKRIREHLGFSDRGQGAVEEEEVLEEQIVVEKDGANLVADFWEDAEGSDSEVGLDSRNSHFLALVLPYSSPSGARRITPRRARAAPAITAQAAAAAAQEADN